MNPSDMVFVFGSNLAGAHGAGAALEAKNRGFPYGLGVGFYPGKLIHQGQYALPTKDCMIQPLDLTVIRKYIVQLRNFAFLTEGKLVFQVTRVGCGLAGYNDGQIAPLFAGAPLDNMYYDNVWHQWLGDEHKYWGTFHEV